MNDTDATEASSDRKADKITDLRAKTQIAYHAYEKARDAYIKARNAYIKASNAYLKAEDARN